MTVPLAAYSPEDIETLLVAHLSPLRRCGFERKPGDPLPFTLVTHITGTESAQEGTADPVVSVHTLYDKTAGAPAARDEATRTHRRMLSLLVDPTIVLSGGRLVAVQYLDVVEQPRWEYYSDTILRKVGRYRLGLPYVAAD
jgi:hypothetical protein